MAPLPPITATLLVSLPWTPERASFIKINTDESIKGKSFTVTLNGLSTSGVFEKDNEFWNSGADGGLTIYLISDDNIVTLDVYHGCPDIESIQLKIDGKNIPIVYQQ